MSRGAEWSYELERARRQEIFNARVSAKTEEFYNRYMSQFQQMSSEGYYDYIPDEMERLESDLASIRNYLVSDPTEAREISQEVGSYIRGMWSLGRSARQQFERAARMRQEAERERERQQREAERRQQEATLKQQAEEYERRKQEQAAMIQEYYTQIGTISPAVVHFAQNELQTVKAELDSGKLTAESFKVRMADIIASAEKKAAEWKQDSANSHKSETVLSHLEEVETEISREKIEDKKKTEAFLEQIKRLKEDVRTGRVDLEKAEQEIAAVETQVDDVVVSEEVRRQMVIACIALLRKQDFTVGRPEVVKEGNEEYVKFTARRPSGNHADFKFSSHGKVQYMFDNYPGMSCMKDITPIQRDLERIYSVKLSDERVLWQNPDRLTKDADTLPGGTNIRSHS